MKKNKIICLLWLFVGGCFFIFLPKVFAEEGGIGTEPLLFKIESNGHIMCLIGSYHFVIEQPKLSQPLKSCYWNANALGIEMRPLPDMEKFFDYYKVNISSGEPSFKDLPEEIKQKANAAMRKAKIDNKTQEKLLTLHPIASYRALMASEYMGVKTKIYPGIDLIFLDAAQQKALTVIEIEGVVQFIVSEKKVPIGVAARKIMAISEIILDEKKFSLFKKDSLAYLKGNETLSADGVYEKHKIFYESVLGIPYELANHEIEYRNIYMKKNIEKLLKEEKFSLVVVGATHLGGPDGILNRLRRDGYIVSNMK